MEAYDGETFTLTVDALFHSGCEPSMADDLIAWLGVDVCLVLPATA